jgi:hypothetical protein
MGRAFSFGRRHWMRGWESRFLRYAVAVAPASGRNDRGFGSLSRRLRPE